jgi:hypothetical protein
MSYEDNARIINDDIFDLVNSCFDLEKSSRNNEGRVNFFNTYKDYFVLTDDGSYSINSKEINHKIETLHTSTGAISESFEKFIKPMKFSYDEDIAILDICAGLGYNSSAAIDDFLKHETDSKLSIDMVEISHATLACGLLVPSPIKAHDITKKAIEDELIKPLLKKLGYEDSEYKQQLYIEIGNHNYALIPDFVLSPVTSNGHYSGFAIIEAKRSITTEKQLEEVKVQARSYAKMVGAKYSSIASQEGIWVTSAKDDYSKVIFHASWAELKNEDTFYELNEMLGNL